MRVRSFQFLPKSCRTLTRGTAFCGGDSWFHLSEQVGTEPGLRTQKGEAASLACVREAMR